MACGNTESLALHQTVEELLNSVKTFVALRPSGLGPPEPEAQLPSARNVSETFDSEPPDEELMARVCNKNRDALALLFRRYSRLVHTISNRVLRDSAEADDLLQDIFAIHLPEMHHFCELQEFGTALDCADDLSPSHRPPPIPSVASLLYPGRPA
jgi:Sigma-70 region 2